MPYLDPRVEYSARLESRRADVVRMEARIDGCGRMRLVVFGGSVFLAIVLNFIDVISPWWAAAGTIPFFYFVLRMKAFAVARIGVVASVRYYERGLERLNGVFRGPTGAEFSNPDHPYAVDLDLFGPGSLFQRLCVARTSGGRKLLAERLLGPASAQSVEQRQQSALDLRDRIDLREQLAVVGGAVESAADLQALAEWGVRSPFQVEPFRKKAILFLGWYNLAAIYGWLLIGTTSIPVVIGLILSVMAVYGLVGASRQLNGPVEEAVDDLGLLESFLLLWERESFTAPRLSELQAALISTDGIPASKQVRELRKLAEWYASRQNPVFIPFAIAMLWDVRFAIRFEQWRLRSGPLVRLWLAELAEAEALMSVAGYAFENPRDHFPTVVEAHEPRIEAIGIGHPLLPRDRCVVNDVLLGGEVRMLLISGSNMSGKSTLLRSVGANVVLALCGAPVRATQLTLTPVALGATMRVQDSLQDGKSRFYAEVTRVRTVLDEAKKNLPPVLFLFDELFSGTNSADRVIGAAAVLRKLLDAGAIGLVTTHDLALTAAASELGSRAVNVHFEDQMTGGVMDFDYKMRPGVVPHGNGLALMRAVGLEV